jgi:hypothetical protein
LIQIIRIAEKTTRRRTPAPELIQISAAPRASAQDLC